MAPALTNGALVGETLGLLTNGTPLRQPAHDGRVPRATMWLHLPIRLRQLPRNAAGVADPVRDPVGRLPDTQHHVRGRVRPRRPASLPHQQRQSMLAHRPVRQHRGPALLHPLRWPLELPHPVFPAVDVGYPDPRRRPLRAREPVVADPA